MSRQVRDPRVFSVFIVKCQALGVEDSERQPASASGLRAHMIEPSYFITSLSSIVQTTHLLLATASHHPHRHSPSPLRGIAITSHHKPITMWFSNSSRYLFEFRIITSPILLINMVRFVRVSCRIADTQSYNTHILTDYTHTHDCAGLRVILRW